MSEDSQQAVWTRVSDFRAGLDLVSGKGSKANPPPGEGAAM
jgi:hypothetical protein